MALRGVELGMLLGLNFMGDGLRDAIGRKGGRIDFRCDEGEVDRQRNSCRGDTGTGDFEGRGLRLRNGADEYGRQIAESWEGPGGLLISVLTALAAAGILMGDSGMSGGGCGAVPGVEQLHLGA